MAQNPNQALFEVRRSKIQGRGVFARQDIPAGTRLMEYTGERISTREADARYDDEGSKRHHTFLFALDSKRVIDATRIGNDARYINHTCSPNCEAVIEKGRVFIEALKSIKAGQELAYDYAYWTDPSYDDADLKALYPCFCGTARCRGTIAAPRKKQARRRAGERATKKSSTSAKKAKKSSSAPAKKAKRKSPAPAKKKRALKRSAPAPARRRKAPSSR